MYVGRRTKARPRDFPGGPVVRNTPDIAGEVWIQFLFGDLRFPHTSRPKNQNINNRSNIVTNQ